MEEEIEKLRNQENEKKLAGTNIPYSQILSFINSENDDDEHCGSCSCPEHMQR